MPKGYSAQTGKPTGAAVRRYFVGMEKLCGKCEGRFLINEAMVRNRSYRCPKCDSKRSVEWAKINREKKRASNNAWHAKNSANRSDRTARYRKNNPEARLAHQAVQSAIRNGTLEKMPCIVCGAVPAHAHHDDYSKPLEVIWLCHQHHMDHHLMLKAREEA